MSLRVAYDLIKYYSQSPRQKYTKTITTNDTGAYYLWYGFRSVVEKHIVLRCGFVNSLTIDLPKRYYRHRWAFGQTHLNVTMFVPTKHITVPEHFERNRILYFMTGVQRRGKTMRQLSSCQKVTKEKNLKTLPTYIYSYVEKRIKYENSLHCRRQPRPSHSFRRCTSRWYITLLLYCCVCVCPSRRRAHNGELINSGLSRLPRAACIQEVYIYMMCVTATVYI